MESIPKPTSKFGFERKQKGILSEEGSNAYQRRPRLAARANNQRRAPTVDFEAASSLAGGICGAVQHRAESQNSTEGS